jgi:predicted nucleotidyltransferase
MDTATKMELAKVVDVIVKEVKGVEAIYLFGSMARGNENPKSDYDIAVIVKKYPRNDLTIIANIKCDLFDKIKRHIDIVILEEKDLGQPSLFLYELFNSHIRLYGRDILKRVAPIVRKVKPDRPILKNGPVWYYV